MKKKLLPILIPIIALFSFSFQGNNSELLQNDRITNWQSDIEFYEKTLRNKHKNLFHFTTEAEFNTKIAALKTKIDHLTDYQMVVELSKISASIGDAHTYIHTDRLLQHWLPLKIGVFEEGFYVLSAMTGYEDLFGGRIVGFDNKSIRVAVS